MQKVLQINMNYNVSTEALREYFSYLTQPIANIKGLIWKLWIIDELEKSCGGVYLFQNTAPVVAYIESDIIKEMECNPDLSNIRIVVSDVLPSFSKITRGPI
ncbi:MAG TPA: hypothetical protein ENI23_09760 [bacterium]|nr:hypothetical protein [bacterium]